ncbi:MAG TPA: class III extradiol ring-cleavage dioxygenase [Acetobacteraceae bacterium]|jgi:4,5-DOPA dioxygenase extradiol|nr:class III extradiol ring-cleavage dioxygenase [Acetobacteraceae bacterium]
MMPTLYISHGSPMTAISDTPARRFLAGLAADLPRPRAILAVSAHWESAAPMLNAVARNATIHDFYGFPAALFAISYPAPGAPELAETIAARLRCAGFQPAIDRARGLDHGAWVPLYLAYPEADIPVVQLSVQTALGPHHHLALGEALADYRRLAPHAAEEHPTEEHLLPLYVALGAAGETAKAKRLHSSVEYGFLRMDAYAFG